MIRPPLPTGPRLPQLEDLKIVGLLLISLLGAAINQETMERPMALYEPTRAPCEPAIHAVIDLEFVGPKAELASIDQKISDQMIEDLGERDALVDHPGYLKGDPELEEYYAYATESYKPYLTDNAIQNFVQTEWPNALRLHRSNLDYRMEPSQFYLQEVEIDGNADGIRSYEFYVFLDYQVRSEEIKNYLFHGWAICTSEGKITHLTLIDRNNFNKQLDTDAEN